MAHSVECLYYYTCVLLTCYRPSPMISPMPYPTVQSLTSYGPFTVFSK